ncbi:RNA polymerase II transcription factor B subunit 4 [Ascosphaera atra]|nr:RNA polymerase II transcription factor B subunit 4 [Ascosphaera atra]
MAGALTLALSYINRETIAYAEANGTARPDDPSNTSGAATTGLDTSAASAAANTASTSAGLQSRILIISVTPSSADAAHQYIPLMNTIFASQRLRIPLDVAVLNGNPVFLQQAADATGGVYMALTDPPEARNGFLEYLLLAFLPDATLRRRNLRTPAQVDVDFRAACFCHRKVVDVGWVCSVCLSIFCEPPPPPQQEGSGSMRESVVEGSGTPSRKRQRESAGGTAAPARSLSSVCLTCGTELSLQTENTGIKPPALLPRRGKKKRKLDGGAGGQRSGTATPRPVKTEQ